MKKLIIGNWKMYPTLSDSLVLATTLKSQLEDIQGVDVAIAPPLPWLIPVRESWRHKLTHLHLAAQNVWPEDQGAYTGEVSAYLLKDVVSLALIGHSERREHGHETNDLIREKIQSCLKWRITPVLCVGETKKAVAENGTLIAYQWSRIVEQLDEAIKGISAEKIEEVVIAYEPVWAIGNGHAANPEYTTAVITRLRTRLAEKYGPQKAAAVRFLYGGSVDSRDAASFLREKEIGGLLVGTASVKAKEFVAICKLAAQGR